MKQLEIHLEFPFDYISMAIYNLIIQFAHKN